ncbi:MAG: hypothetical protein IKU93_07345 [Alistipes sp.]|nr:hypothetical protein [Alistipes sp.]
MQSRRPMSSIFVLVNTRVQAPTIAQKQKAFGSALHIVSTIIRITKGIAHINTGLSRYDIDLLLRLRLALLFGIGSTATPFESLCSH